MQNIIIKRSNLGFMNFPTSDKFVIKRAITIKEALTKASKTETDCLVIEGTTDTELTAVVDLLDNLNIKETLIVLLSEPSITLDATLLNRVRAELLNNRQLVWLTNYTTDLTYNQLFEELENVWLPEFKTAKEQGEKEARVVEHKSQTQQKEEQDLEAVAQVSYTANDNTNDIMLQLEYQISSLQEELRIAKNFIAEMTENPNISLTSVGGAETTRLYEENNSLREEITRLTSLQEKFDDLTAQIAILNVQKEQDVLITDMWRTLLEGIFDYSQEIKNAQEEAEQILANAADAAGVTKQTVTNLQTKVEEQEAQIIKLSEMETERQAEIAELHIDLDAALDAGERLQQKNDELDAILTRLQAEKRQLSAELGQATAEIAKLSTYDVTQLRQMAKDGGNVQQILEEKMRTAKEALTNSEAKNRQLSKELSNARNVIENLTREKRILEGMLDGENYGGATLSWLTPVQARIWAFVGHGGQGCTTIAHSVASRLYELGKNVVIVDCDFRAPKQHVLCKVDPCIEYTKFTNITTELRTSLGKLLTNGAACYNNFEQEMVITVKEEQQGQHRFDLLSGLLSVRAASEVASLDINTLCVELAKRYDYIIIDLGRAEGNGGVARQQSIILRNANRKFIVSTNDLENVKSTVNRLIQANVNIDATEFIFDMVQEKPDKNLAQITRRVRHTWEIPFAKNMIGKALPMPTTTPAIKQLVAFELGK